MTRLRVAAAILLAALLFVPLAGCDNFIRDAFAQPAPTDPSVVTLTAPDTTVTVTETTTPTGTTTVTETAPAPEPVVVDPGGETVVVDTGEGTTVVVPYGNWLDSLLEHAGSLIGAAILAIFAYLLRSLPAGVVAVIRTFSVEQMLSRAVDYAIGATRSAVKGKELNVDVGSEVIAKALNFVISKAPAWMIDWLGGPQEIITNIMARLKFDSTVSSEAIIPVANAKIDKGMR